MWCEAFGTVPLKTDNKLPRNLTLPILVCRWWSNNNDCEVILLHEQSQQLRGLLCNLLSSSEMKKKQKQMVANDITWVSKWGFWRAFVIDKKNVLGFYKISLTNFVSGIWSPPQPSCIGQGLKPASLTWTPTNIYQGENVINCIPTFF